jgi:uncharacterized protein involved in exopolysaccharide biosynthesis
MNETTGSQQVEEETDLDIGAVATVLWKGKGVIGLLTAVGAIVAVVYVFVQPEIFRSEALLQPRQQSGSLGRLAGLGALAAELGGISGAALPTAGGTERDVSVATLRSRAVIEAFITENDLLPKIYESKWDRNAKVWKNPTRAPTVWEAYNDFTKDVLEIREDRRTGLVTIAVEWTNPEEARQWVTEIVARTNAHLKQRAIQEGEKNLAYLQSQVQQIGQVELVQALYGLVEEQLKQMMVAKGGDEFALKTVDPAVVPKKRIRPSRVLTSLVGLFVGGLLGVLVTLGRASWTRPKGPA